MKKELQLASSRTTTHAIILLFLFILFFAGYRSCQKSGSFDWNSGSISELVPKPPSSDGSFEVGITTLALSKSPKYVRQLVNYLKSVKHFQPPKGFKGGRIFKNREGILPKENIYYEFDVLPSIPGVPRGAERLVVDQAKRLFYYTKDHYMTFMKIQ